MKGIIVAEFHVSCPPNGPGVGGEGTIGVELHMSCPLNGLGVET